MHTYLNNNASNKVVAVELLHFVIPFFQCFFPKEMLFKLLEERSLLLLNIGAIKVWLPETLQK